MKKLKISIVEIILWVIGIIIFALAIFRKNIFPTGSVFYNLYDDIKSFESSNTVILVRIIKSVIIIYACVMIARISKLVLALPKKKNQRLMTTLSLLESVIKYVCYIAMLIFVLRYWGVNTTAIIASAGIITLIVGLGCQTLVADIVSGLFIIFEGDFQVGDVVVIGGWRGTVQSIGIRTTKILDISGNVKIINNSSITDIVNNTKQLSVAICDCDVDYGDSIERIEAIIEANLDYIKKRIPAIVEGPFYKGVENLGESGVTIRLVANCKEDDKFQVRRDMNREIKLIFDKNKVNIPFPQIVVNQPVVYEQTEYKNMDAFVDEQKELSKNVEDAEGNE